MANALLYFLPGIVALGIVTSYEDIRFSRIRNKWVILGIAYAVIAYGVLRLFVFAGIGFAGLLTNFLFSIAAGFGLWYFGLWSAGDGKLFIAFSLLLPLQAYSLGYVRWIPSITLLINTYVPAVVFLIITLLFRLRLRHVRDDLRSVRVSSSRALELIKSLPGLFVIFWLMQALLSISAFGSNPVLTIILTLLTFTAVQNAMSNRAVVIMAIISFSRFIVDKAVYTLPFWISFSAAFIVWGVVRRFVQDRLISLSKIAFGKEISTSDLRPDMYLGVIICKTKKKPKSEHISYSGSYYYTIPKVRTAADSFIDSDSLTDEQIKTIRKIGFRKVMVSETLPFALFLFLGVIITLAVKGNILIFLKNLV